jgi:hypothetical protein
MNVRVFPFASYQVPVIDMAGFPAAEWQVTDQTSDKSIASSINQREKAIRISCVKIADTVKARAWFVNA